LLQGSYYNASDLADIARMMDDNERTLLSDSGFLGAQESSNVADDGFFSVQVLSSALENAFGIILVPILSEAGRDARENPTKEIGFVCHLHDHWFAIRRIEDEWYNLNSSFNYPQKLSQFYLSAFLDSLMKGGYSIFVARGDFPPFVEQYGQPNWSVVPDKPPPQQSQPQDDDEEMRRALQLSLQESESNDRVLQQLNSDGFVDGRVQAPLYDMGDDDDDLRRAIEASLSQTNGSSVPSFSSFPQDIMDEDEDDDDLQAALLLSQQQESSFPSTGASVDLSASLDDGAQSDEEELAILLSMQGQESGTEGVARVLVEDTVNKSSQEFTVPNTTTLRNLLKLVRFTLQISPSTDVVLATNYPMKEFTDLSLTVEEVGWHPRTKVFLKRK